MPKIMTKEEFVGNHIYYVRYTSYARQASEYEHKHWINDSIPVHPKLATFYNEFKFKRRNIIPVVGDESVVRVDHPDDGEWYRAYMSIGIAYKDAPEYRVGTLRMEHNKQNELVYEVESDLIENEKFSSGSDGYTRKRTKNFAAAVKTAVAYIKPMSLERLALEEGSVVARAVTELKIPAMRELREVTSIDQDTVLSELTHMVATGYIPVTADFAKAMKVMQEQGAELRRLESYAPRECWVWGRRDGTVAYQFHGEAVCEVANIHAVPEFIRDKIAVLQIGELHNAIMDVGVKIGDTLYCVFV